MFWQYVYKCRAAKKVYRRNRSVNNAAKTGLWIAGILTGVVVAMNKEALAESSSALSLAMFVLAGVFGYFGINGFRTGISYDQCGRKLTGEKAHTNATMHCFLAAMLIAFAIYVVIFGMPLPG